MDSNKNENKDEERKKLSQNEIQPSMKIFNNT